MAKPYVSIPRLVMELRGLRNSGGQVNAAKWGRIIATIEDLQRQAAAGSSTSPVPIPNAGGGGPAMTGAPSVSGGGGSSFMKYFFPITDTIGVAASIGGRIANAIYKSKAAKQIARGNAAQHLAAGMSTPQSQAIFGSPISEVAKISADAGQANAAASLAKGEAWQGSLQDISNLISSVNTMRRLLNADSLSAMGLIAMQRMATANAQRGP